MKNIKKYHLITLFSLLLSSNLVLAQSHKVQVLVLFHSDEGGTYEMAKEVAKGIESEGLVTAVIKKVKETNNPKFKDVPLATVDELSSYAGIAFGSPVYFGNISTAMSEFLAKTTGIWSQHGLEGMPATVFMSSGSGAGRELAMQSFWNSLAVHGMVLVANGIRGYEDLDKSIPQGNTVLGTTSLASLKNVPRPSEGERNLARLQGQNFAQIALALQSVPKRKVATAEKKIESDVYKVLQNKNITLPTIPKPAGNYKPYVRTGNLIYINQYAMGKSGIVHPGKVLVDVTEEEVKEATRVTMLNVLAVLNDALDGDLNRVKRCVNMMGVFNAPDNYANHALLMNAASDLVVELFGDKGKHARSTLGASSIPGNSPVELMTIFEVE